VRFLPTELPEVMLVEPELHRDERGFFLETYHAEKFRAGGIAVRFVQDNHSGSRQGILRGLHAQCRRPQGKLVRVVEGEVFDVALDIRRGSSTFARWVAVRLSAENFRQCYIPPGFAHGFCVVTAFAQVEYKCTNVYDPDDQITIRWNDPDLAIPWPIQAPILSAKDASAPTLRDVMHCLPSAVQDHP
jgi:dTDP-4-dehydrorhamnose 3,5-epimerase